MSDIQPVGSSGTGGSTAPATASGTGRGTRLRDTIELQILPKLVAKHTAPETGMPLAMPDPATHAAATRDPATRDAGARDTTARLAVELAMDAAGPHPERVQARLERLLDGGADPEALCLEVLAPAARHLGHLWVEDELDFVDVTLGTMRLERALRGLMPSPGPVARRAGRQPTILMTPLPGNQHTFGLTMAADFFRRGGWMVSEGSAPSPRTTAADALAALEQQLRAQSLDAVGLAVSCEVQVDLLTRTLAMVRAASRNPRIRIALGGPLFLVQPGMASRFDADLVVTDGALAPAQLAALLPDPEARRGVAGPDASGRQP